MATETKAPNLGPDGEVVVDMTFYDLLGVASDADEATIKKAYRKAALKYHPDRNIGDETAAAKFQEIGEAFNVLSDSNLRAVYNKQGKNVVMDKAEQMPDPGQMFSQIFGGEAFMDWIGEISLGKDVSKAFEMSTTEEEREQLKNEMKAGRSATPQQSTVTSAPAPGEPAASAPSPPREDPSSTVSSSTPIGASAIPDSSTAVSSPSLTASASTPQPSQTAHSPAAAAATAALEKDRKAAERAAEKAARQAEREKLEAYDRQRSEEKRQRVDTLVRKLVDRVRPFVESTNPGGEGDPETLKYGERIRQETHDLALESFGVEICHLIGEVYMQKASAYIKLHKKPSANILGIPAWGNRVKEKFTTVKEGWSFLSAGLDVQSAMKDMEKRQQAGEMDEEEMQRIEGDLSGKLLLVAWKGSRFELSGILRSVVDGALTKESPNVTDAVLMNRAKAILFTGAILKATQPDESDEERRELERLVAEANAKRKEAKGGKAAKGAKAAPSPSLKPTA